jgi:transcriptional regulator with PAS, ATPase and Fis domain
MERILFSWVGRTDLRAAAENKADELGPIAQVASKGEFARLVLLNNYGPESDPEGYVAWLKGYTEAEVELISVALPSPTDFSAIYVAAREQVENALRTAPRSTVPVFHLSPGTPAMAAVWIMLGKGRFPSAELLQSSREKGVERVDMPFNITAEFIPDMKKGTDQRLVSLAYAVPEKSEFSSIVHRCNAMKKVVAQAHLISSRNVPVLIEGETGTGKELFARAIHRESERIQGPFVAVNCGAIPRELFEAEFFGYKKGAFTGAESDHPGYFEQADGGTLFLDELGELPIDAQVKVLRILNDGVVRRLAETKDRNVDVRIIAATNRNLLQEVADGNFRADLFYRLAVAMLKLPPLREREGDLSLLIDSMLDQVNGEMADSPGYKSKKFSANAKNLMVQHPWPGNAREMFNTIMRICVWCQGGTIQSEDVQQALLPSATQEKNDILQKPLGGGFKLQEIIGVISSDYIRKALSETGGNKSKAAKLLGFKNYQTLNNWMSKYGVEA